jgi:hypothetical protein
VLPRALVALLLSAASAGDRLPPAEPEPPPPAASPSESGRRERAASLLRGGAASRAVLLEAARGAPPALRAAALVALAAAAEPGAADPAALGAGIAALSSRDPSVREAGVDLLAALGPAAEEALVPLATAAPAPAPGGPPPSRAKHALDEIRRARIEADFLAAWRPDDGSYRGQFDSLKVHGALGARVLAFIALDRRVAGDEDLGFGPYRWRVAPPGDRERTEIRERALAALSDAGDVAVRELLRRFLRVRPSDDLGSSTDPDPVPARFDDEMRHVMACLGDPLPLLEVLARSPRGSFGTWSRLVELGRRASACTRLGQVSPPGPDRRAWFVEAEKQLVESMRERERIGLGVNGVDYYNLACVQAQRDGPGDRAKAIGNLRRSVETRAVDSAWFQKDGDLATLREEPAFQRMVAELRAVEEAQRKRFGGR